MRESVEPTARRGPAPTRAGTVRVRPYERRDAGGWDHLVRASWNGTFLHTRRFLGYHGDRFVDRSLVAFDGKDRLVGVLPAASPAGEAASVTSHPGATYGGWVHAGGLQGARMIEAFEAAAEAWTRAGLRELRYKAVPHIYPRVPAGDDLYALFRLGADRDRCDLSATIDLAGRPKPRSRRRRGHRAALRAGIVVARGPGYLREFWPVLEDNLRRKHDARPVHTIEEIELLQDLFPTQVQCVVGRLGGRTVAGVVLFKSPRVTHAQYIASSPEGYEASALDAIFDACITSAADEGAHHFDFGTSTEQAGAYLNEGLYTFKTEFGAGGVVCEFFRWRFV